MLRPLLRIRSYYENADTHSLQCFYDNIVFAPFIFIEDPLDVNGQRGLVPEAISRRMSTIGASSPGGLNGTGSTLLGKGNKIDPYYLITRVCLPLLIPMHWTDWVIRIFSTISEWTCIPLSPRRAHIST